MLCNCWILSTVPADGQGGLGDVEGVEVCQRVEKLMMVARPGDRPSVSAT